MSEKPIYTEEFKASAILMLEAAGWPNTEGALSRVARHLGIHKQTLDRWAKRQQSPPSQELVTTLKIDVVELLDHIIFGVAREVARRIDKDELDSATIPQLMTGLGIAIDKKQLLTNAPTQNINHTVNAMTDEERYQRMKELAAAITDAIRSDN